MRRLTFLIVLIALTAFGCATKSGSAVPSSTDPSALVTTTEVAFEDELPSGSTLRVELDETLGIQSSAGEVFTATVVREVRAKNGSPVIPVGSRVFGEVTEVKPSETVNHPGTIRLYFEAIEVRGERQPLTADVLSTELRVDEESSEVARDVGVGVAAGAILGAIITGDARDAISKGTLGVSAGTEIGLGTGDVNPELEEGTVMVLRTTNDVAIATR